MAIGTPTLRQVAGAAAASATTASFTPAASSKLFAWASGSSTSAVPGKPTISDSQSLTWVEVGSVSLNGGTADTYSALYYAEVGASPAAMTVTASSASSQRTMIVTFDVTGVGTDFSNQGTNTNAAGDPSITLGSFASGSAGFGFASGIGDQNFTPPAGYIELYDASPAALTRRQNVVYDLTSPGTTLSWTSSAIDAVALAVEFKEAAAGGGISAGASLNEADDTVSSSSTLALKATAAITEASDTASASGTLALNGTASITEAADTVSAAGGITSPGISGAASIAGESDTVSSAAVLTVSASAAITEANDTAEATAFIVSADHVAGYDSTVRAPAEIRSLVVQREYRSVSAPSEIRRAYSKAETRRATV